MNMNRLALPMVLVLTGNGNDETFNGRWCPDQGKFISNNLASNQHPFSFSLVNIPDSALLIWQYL
jgi:hypothetical protein